MTSCTSLRSITLSCFLSSLFFLSSFLLLTYSPFISVSVVMKSEISYCLETLYLWALLLPPSSFLPPTLVFNINRLNATFCEEALATFTGDT
ncbi:uncharacterized protein BDW43DRAFT_284048 [Aspergillus alliaceus]|uniref:uncharacterized protein n=1 Tax=Petromyces alliaceus TaxID=209559 RepID=UPI0012A6E609|nr:uncharacterized protein BDW43DRAFT_284048 [Aspergillus alliaceus]KAB8230808.1 hypothetical protein BDW43DRAFT_284048 [Aspergillus alliaceus]